MLVPEMMNPAGAIRVISEDRKSADAVNALQFLQDTSADEGLDKDEINDLVDLLINSQSAAFQIQIMHCLVPKTTVSVDSLKKILGWFFTGSIYPASLSISVQKTCLNWLIGITHHGLSDLSVMRGYYHNFLHLMKCNDQLVAPLCKLLGLITKPEDATRWVVEQILFIRRRSASTSCFNPLLSILKSYRPEIVTECVSKASFKNNSTIEKFERAHARKIAAGEPENSESDELNCVAFNIPGKVNELLMRLIPMPEPCNSDSKIPYNRRHLGMTEIKSIASLGSHPLQMELPAQVLSLLASNAGHHMIGVLDELGIHRFLNNLQHVFLKVFLMNSESYSEEEKKIFLDSVTALQNCIHQGIPVVHDFILKYLPLWDGCEFQDQILGLLEWDVEVDEREFRDHILHPLRLNYHCLDVKGQYKIIQTLAKMISNVVVTTDHEKKIFATNNENYDPVSRVKIIAQFASEIITEGINWNDSFATRELLTAALDFYDVCQAAEKVADLPVMVMIPPALVYGCLFSNSSVCIDRLCSILVKHYSDDLERLATLGVNEKVLEKDALKLEIYVHDCYRYLWSNINHAPEMHSYLFREKSLNNKMSEFSKIYGETIKDVFRIDRNPAFWDGERHKSPDKLMESLSKSYPSIVNLKELFETQY